MSALDDFKNRTINGSFGNPKTNTYVGQCVSYVRKYMEEVLGIPTGANGDAKDYYNNSTSNYFDKVPNPQNGNIVVYGAYGNNPYGHIGIWYNGQLLSQNYDKPLHVSLASPTLIGNRLGYLRLKGAPAPEEVPMPNEGDAVNFLKNERGDSTYTPSQGEVEAAMKVSFKDWAYRLSGLNEGDAVNMLNAQGLEVTDASKGKMLSEGFKHWMYDFSGKLNKDFVPVSEQLYRKK